MAVSLSLRDWDAAAAASYCGPMISSKAIGAVRWPAFAGGGVFVIHQQFSGGAQGVCAGDIASWTIRSTRSTFI
jgi:hypothetical protein